MILLFSPLLGAIGAGFFGLKIGKMPSAVVTIAGLAISFVASVYLCSLVFVNDYSQHWLLYNWVNSGRFHLNFGFLVDKLTVVMAVVVTFVSLLVHLYSVGYMRDDPGYQRFFAYMSLFTFFMLSLVTADNFMQLFFGWEGVGLVSYLLIGFWYTKKSAAEGSLKAFIVNRIGDFGFILGIAALLDFAGTLDYAPIFAKLSQLAHAHVALLPGYSAPLLTVVAVCLFIGAMGKSAQIPLHVWLPESMAGPTPISALIHAATMVTAGVFMVARLSPLYNFAPAALSLVLIVGATGALFLGLLAVVENDIKRIIAYSTMSQLGYMMAANGAGAYSIGIFHLATHACFKALLFLGAGAIIIALNHEQDINKMSGLAKRMPLVFVCFLIGALALSAVPPFAGFYSKELIIDAVYHTSIFGSLYAYICLLLGAIVTSFYTFRLVFKVFLDSPNATPEPKPKLKSDMVIKAPLVALAIPSFLLGMLLFSDVVASSDWLGSSVINKVLIPYQSAFSMYWHAPMTPGFWCAILGIAVAVVCYVYKPQVPLFFEQKLAWVKRLLLFQYGFDSFNNKIVVATKYLANLFFYTADEKYIDKVCVNGTGFAIRRLARVLRLLQSGYLYHYILFMILFMVVFLVWLAFGN